MLSPDGRWLAYVSNEQGANEVFVRPYPGVNGGKVATLEWRRQCSTLVAQRMRVVLHGQRKNARCGIQPGPTVSAQPPRALFTIPVDIRAGSPLRGTFAISPDARRLLVVRDNKWEDMAGTPILVVVQNFVDELRAKLKRQLLPPAHPSPIPR